MPFFRKLFKLLRSTELDASDCNVLPSREFTPDETRFCWEDWHVEVKKDILSNGRISFMSLKI